MRVSGRNRRRGWGCRGRCGLALFGSGSFPLSRKGSLRIPAFAGPLRAPSSLCQKLPFASTFDVPKFGKAPRPAATAIREGCLRIQSSPTGEFFLVAPATRPQGRLLLCAQGGFPPPLPLSGISPRVALPLRRDSPRGGKTHRRRTRRPGASGFLDSHSTGDKE